jgi:hypothetical protein
VTYKLDTPRNTTSWGIATANTFRNESKALFKRPGYKGIGTNLQNPSDRICQLYIPDTGKIFVQADQSGAEALIVAYLCTNGNYRLLFEHSIKPHTYIALRAFPTEWYKTFDRTLIDILCCTPLDKLTSNPSWKEVSTFIKDANQVGGQGLQYYLGKKACHSFNYKKQAQTFIFDILKDSEGKIVLNLKDGQYIYDIYHSLFPEIQEWHRDQEAYLRQTRELRNLQGYPRKFFGAFTDKFFREAISFVPQSTVGTITNIAFVELQRQIEAENLPYDLLNNKHDSILMQVPIECLEDGARRLKKVLTPTLVSPRGEVFTMKAEVAAGYNWSKADNKHNPTGLSVINI